MLSDLEIRAIAQDVVDRSKRSSRVDTGALRRSISYTLVRGVVTFRELYYGQFGSNSELEKNASRYMPVGTEWRIIYTEFGGGTYEVGRTKGGRATQKSTLSTIAKSSSNNIKALLTSIRKKKKKDGDKED